MLLAHDYTRENHFRFGYDGADWFDPRPDMHAAWRVAYGPCKRAPADWRTENREAAAEIVRRHGDVVLLLSGGADSEIALRAFRDAGHRIRCWTIRYRGDLNAADVSDARSICEDLDVPFHAVDLDLAAFFSSGECDEIAEQAKASSPTLCVTLWAASKILADAVPVIGQGEMFLEKQVPPTFEHGAPYDDSPFALVEREWVATWYRFFIARGQPGIPGFHQYTPEQMLAFLRDPETQALLNHQRHPLLHNGAAKTRVYARHYPDFRFRPKQTGFERAGALAQAMRSRLAYRNWPYTRTAITPVATLTRMLEGAEA